MVEQVTAIRALRQGLAGYGALLDPGVLSPRDCDAVMREASAIQNIAATIVALAGARVAETDLWGRDGDKTPAHALARKTGQSVGRAREQLETGARLRSQPDVDAAARNGELSPDEAAAISDAAAAAPAKARELVERAKNASLKELRDECQKVKANADPDPDATRRRIHRERRIRTFVDREGAWNLHARGLPEQGAEFMAALQPLWDAIFTRARSGGTVEPSEAYGFDALVELARHAHTKAPPAPAAPAASSRPCSQPEPQAEPQPQPESWARPRHSAEAPPLDGRVSPDADPPADARPPYEGARPDVDAPPEPEWDEGPKPWAQPSVQAPTIPSKAPARIIVRVDLPTLLRGRPADGETCDIVGIGPVSVAAVRDLMASHPFMAAVITKGQQVMGVAHLGRGANARQATALLWSMPTCTVDGCPATAHLENDHRTEYSRVGETELSNLDPLCGHHHHLKTTRGWALIDGTGKRPMVPPDHPDHPRHHRQPEAAA